MTSGADLKLLRAAVFTAVCVLLSAAGHATAAGAPLPLWVLGAGCALVFAAAAPLAGRERSLPAVAALLVAGQAALHVLFSVAHRPPPGAAEASPVGPQALARRLLCNDAAAGALTDGEARRIVADAGLSPGLAGHVGHAGAQAAPHTGAHTSADGVRIALDAALGQFSLPMLLGHLLTAVAVGWLLHRGEAALRGLVRLSAAPARAAEDLLTVRALRAAVRLLRALRHGLTAGGAPAAPTGRRTPDRATPLPAQPLAGGVSRRGPPCAQDDLHLAA